MSSQAPLQPDRITTSIPAPNDDDPFFSLSSLSPPLHGGQVKFAKVARINCAWQTLVYERAATPTPAGPKRRLERRSKASHLHALRTIQSDRFDNHGYAVADHVESDLAKESTSRFHPASVHDSRVHPTPTSISMPKLSKTPRSPRSLQLLRPIRWRPFSSTAWFRPTNLKSLRGSIFEPTATAVSQVSVTTPLSLSLFPLPPHPVTPASARSPEGSPYSYGSSTVPSYYLRDESPQIQLTSGSDQQQRTAKHSSQPKLRSWFERQIHRSSMASPIGNVVHEFGETAPNSTPPRAVYDDIGTAFEKITKKRLPLSSPYANAAPADTSSALPTRNRARLEFIPVYSAAEDAKQRRRSRSLAADPLAVQQRYSMLLLESESQNKAVEQESSFERITKGIPSYADLYPVIESTPTKETPSQDQRGYYDDDSFMGLYSPGTATPNRSGLPMPTTITPIAASVEIRNLAAGSPGPALDEVEAAATPYVNQVIKRQHTVSKESAGSSRSIHSIVAHFHPSEDGQSSPSPLAIRSHQVEREAGASPQEPHRLQEAKAAEDIGPRQPLPDRPNVAPFRPREFTNSQSDFSRASDTFQHTPSLMALEEMSLEAELHASRRVPTRRAPSTPSKVKAQQTTERTSPELEEYQRMLRDSTPIKTAPSTPTKANSHQFILADLMSSPDIGSRPEDLKWIKNINSQPEVTAVPPQVESSPTRNSALRSRFPKIVDQQIPEDHEDEFAQGTGPVILYSPSNTRLPATTYVNATDSTARPTVRTIPVPAFHRHEVLPGMSRLTETQRLALSNDDGPDRLSYINSSDMLSVAASSPRSVCWSLENAVRAADIPPMSLQPVAGPESDWETVKDSELGARTNATDTSSWFDYNTNDGSHDTFANVTTHPADGRYQHFYKQMKLRGATTHLPLANDEIRLPQYEYEKGTAAFPNKNALTMPAPARLPHRQQPPLSMSHDHPLRANQNPFRTRAIPMTDLSPQVQEDIFGPSASQSQSKVSDTAPRHPSLPFKLINLSDIEERSQASKSNASPKANVGKQVSHSTVRNSVIAMHGSPERKNVRDIRMERRKSGNQAQNLTHQLRVGDHRMPSESLSDSNSFAQFSSLGPKHNITGTPNGTGMKAVGSSLVGSSSPFALFDSPTTIQEGTPHSNISMETIAHSESPNSVYDQSPKTISSRRFVSDDEFLPLRTTDSGRKHKAETESDPTGRMWWSLKPHKDLDPRVNAPKMPPTRSLKALHFDAKIKKPDRKYAHIEQARTRPIRFLHSPKLDLENRPPSSIFGMTARSKQDVSCKVFFFCLIFPPILLLYGWGFFDATICSYTGGRISTFSQAWKQRAKIVGSTVTVATITGLMVFFAVFFTKSKSAV